MEREGYACRAGCAAACVQRRARHLTPFRARAAYGLPNPDADTEPQLTADVEVRRWQSCTHLARFARARAAV